MEQLANFMTQEIAKLQKPVKPCEAELNIIALIRTGAEFTLYRQGEYFEIDFDGWCLIGEMYPNDVDLRYWDVLDSESEAIPARNFTVTAWVGSDEFIIKTLAA